MWKLQIKQTTKSLDGKFDIPEKVTYKDKDVQNLLYIVKALAEVTCDDAEYTLTKEEEADNE